MLQSKAASQYSSLILSSQYARKKVPFNFSHFSTSPNTPFCFLVKIIFSMNLDYVILSENYIRFFGRIFAFHSAKGASFQKQSGSFP